MGAKVPGPEGWIGRMQELYDSKAEQRRAGRVWSARRSAAFQAAHFGGRMEFGKGKPAGEKK